MAFRYQNLGLIIAGRINLWAYKTDDDLVEVTKTGYFVQAALNPGDRIEVSAKDEAQATLGVLEPRKGKARVAVLACYDPEDTLDTRKKPERKVASTGETGSAEPVAA